MTAPKRRRNAPPPAPDDASITGASRSRPDSVDGRTPDPGKEQDARLETYEQEVERASVESLAEPAWIGSPCTGSAHWTRASERSSLRPARFRPRI